MLQIGLHKGKINLCSELFIAALFVMGKDQKQP